MEVSFTVPKEKLIETFKFMLKEHSKDNAMIPAKDFNIDIVAIDEDNKDSKFIKLKVILS